METKEVIGVKILQNKKVTIKPIIRGRAFASKESKHDGKFMFTGCKERFTLKQDKNTGAFVNVFAEGEREAFEKELQLESGELSLYKRKSPFWAKFWVELDKNPKVLDLNLPVHALQLKVLQSYTDIIAPDWDSREFKPSYKWAIVDEDAVIEKESKLANRMLEAMTLFQGIQKSQKQMLDVLRLLDKKPDRSANKDFLQKEITKVIAQIEKIPGSSNIDDFIKAASDKQASDKIFVLDALDAKVIVVDRTSNEFRELESNKLLGKSLQGVVDHYGDPMYQEDRLLIEEKIKRANR